MVKKKKTTTRAGESLNRRYFERNAEMMEMLEEERANADIAQQIYDLRTKAGLSQRQLAKLVGTQPSAICRLEDADYDGHSVAMLQRIAFVLGKRVKVRFVPLKANKRATSRA